MRWLPQEMVNSLNKTTEEGFAEALMICIASLKNERGLLLNIHLGDSIEQEIVFSKQIARMMLNKEKENDLH
jgi:hypothetical protein